MGKECTKSKTIAYEKEMCQNCKCGFKCTDKMSYTKRLQYFSSYCKLDLYTAQRDFIHDFINEKSPESYILLQEKDTYTSSAYFHG